MSDALLQLSESDFDAYLPERATSNAFVRPRLDLKQRAVAWVRRAGARLEALGLELEVHASDEYPSLRNGRRVDRQWVTLSRAGAERELVERLLDRGPTSGGSIDLLGLGGGGDRHASLGLRIDAGGLVVALVLRPAARVDLENALARLRTEEASALVAAVRDLPEPFAFGLEGAEAAPVADLDAPKLGELLESALGGRGALEIGWRVPRATATAHAEILDEQLEGALLALAPAYRALAWSREADRIGLDRRLEETERERRRAHDEVSAQTERWRAEREAEQRARSQLAAERARERAARAPAPPTLATLFKPKARPEPPRLAPEAPSRATREAAPETARAALPVEPALVAAPDRPLEKGARVRILAGPFDGKIGTVAELDGKGGARVLLGLLVARLETRDLEPVLEARDRPSLQSSHLRPEGRGRPLLRSSPDPRKAR